MHALRRRAAAWLRIARLHFYPPVVALYLTGALLARREGAPFEPTACALGAAFLFLVVLATSMANERADHAADSVNANAGPFTGGSRVLVEGRLGFAAVRAAILAAVAAALVVGAALVLRAPAERRTMLVPFLAAALLLGLGYTLPPLKLSARGLGEVDVAFMHSLFVAAFGHAIQTGRWRAAPPLLLSLPCFFAVLGAITLAAIPDHAADATIGKRSWSVRFGRRNAAAIAVATTILAAVAGLWLWLSGRVPGVPGAAFLLAAAHGVALSAGLARARRAGALEGRIDGLLLNALTYTLWFTLMPLLHVLRP